jgi:WD40 repeat protein
MKPTQTYRRSDGSKMAPCQWQDPGDDKWTTDRLGCPIGQELRTLRGHTNAPTRLALSADGGILVSASDENTIKVWDSRAGNETNVLHHQSYLLSMAVSRDGKLLATSDPNFHTISVWEVLHRFIHTTQQRHGRYRAFTGRQMAGRSGGSTRRA